MKVTKAMVERIFIEDIKRLDPITVYIERYGHGEAKVNIGCWGKSWVAFWGAMGGPVEEFFERTNVGYLVNCFDRGLRSVTDEVDTEAWYSEFSEAIKKKILEVRYDRAITASVAREWFDCEWAHKYSLPFVPLHFSDDIRKPFDLSVEDVFCDEEDWLEFCSLIPITHEENHHYTYLSRIVEVVKDVVTQKNEIKLDIENE